MTMNVSELCNVNDQTIIRLRLLLLLFISSALTLSSSFVQADGKLLGTAGASPVEGGGGGGLIPWAMLAGYATQDEWAGVAAVSHTDMTDFRMNSLSVAANYHDRVELSFGRIDFRSKAGGDVTRQNVAGLKVRLLGDLIYGDEPVVSVGVQYKSLLDTDTARASGAKDTTGTDFYVSAARVWLDGLVDRTVLLNANLRNTEANQLGLLGFGGDEGGREWLFEGAAAVYLDRYWAVGVEYREKPDNLSALREEDWAGIFVAYFPSKSVSVTAAYLNLGDVAGESNQSGMYLSTQGSF